MNKIKVRCYKAYANIGRLWNIEVFYNIPESYNVKLFTCTSCGEIFVIDFENPLFKNKTFREIAKGYKCPVCDSNLEDVIEKYPETFKYKELIGNFEPSRLIRPDEEGEIKEIYEIPGKK